MSNKGVDQTAQIRRLVCAFVVTKSEDRFSYTEAHFTYIYMMKVKLVHLNFFYNNTLYGLVIVTILLASRNLSHTLAFNDNASMRIIAVSPKPSLLTK